MKEKLDEIGGARLTDKKLLLAASPELKQILLYAYNPFKRYYMQAPNTCGVVGGMRIDSESFEILDRLSTRDLSGFCALEVVCDHICNLDVNSADVFKGIINKDLRIGIGAKTINTVFPGLIPLTDDGSAKPDIMLCKTFDPGKAEYPVVAAIKKDGVRGRVVDYAIRTRAGHKFVGFEHIEDELEKYGFEKDGEVVVPGLDFDGSSGLIRNRQAVPTAEIWLFDVPSVDETKWGRYCFMRDHIKETRHIKIIEHRLICSYEELNEFYQEALEAGEEGLVVYTNDHEYRDARSWDWCRMVPLKKADCIVIGFEEGKGKFAGSLGKIIVDFNGHKVKVGTGFNEKPWDDLTEKQREKAAKDGKGSNKEDYESRRRGYIWENRPFFLGMISENVYKEKTKKGSMRQPRFKGWRLDKKEANCE